MGQRHQYIIVYPEMFLSEGNPNNKPQRAEVIHHQWLYGRSAILSLERVLRLIKNSWDGTGTDYLFGRDDRGYTGGDGTNALAAAMSVDPGEGYYHRVSVWEAADWNCMTKAARESWAIPDTLDPDMFDNNDGITLIQFECGEKLPKYAFLTPGHLEGSHWKDRDGRGPWSAIEYLDFYYSAKEQAEWSEDTFKRIVSSLEFIRENAILMTPKAVSDLLPKFTLGKRLKAV